MDSGKKLGKSYDINIPPADSEGNIVYKSILKKVMLLALEALTGITLNLKNIF